MGDEHTDAMVKRLLVARVAADTGIDVMAAARMVADVLDRGADSPHSGTVAAAAVAVMAPVMEAFSRFGVALSDWPFAHVSGRVAPVRQ